jgi:transcriptional regulator with XRE-family HTH domain
MKKRNEIDERTWKLVRKIARNIQRIRKAQSLTQEDMAELGFGPRWYQRFESGSHIPTIPTLDKLSRAFKVDITEFFK